MKRNPAVCSMVEHGKAIWLLHWIESDRTGKTLRPRFCSPFNFSLQCYFIVHISWFYNSVCTAPPCRTTAGRPIEGAPRWMSVMCPCMSDVNKHSGGLGRSGQKTSQCGNKIGHANQTDSTDQLYK